MIYSSSREFNDTAFRGTSPRESSSRAKVWYEEWFIFIRGYKGLKKA